MVLHARDRYSRRRGAARLDSSVAHGPAPLNQCAIQSALPWTTRTRAMFPRRCSCTTRSRIGTDSHRPPSVHSKRPKATWPAIGPEGAPSERWSGRLWVLIYHYICVRRRARSAGRQSTLGQSAVVPSCACCVRKAIECNHLQCWAVVVGFTIASSAYFVCAASQRSGRDPKRTKRLYAATHVSEDVVNGVCEARG